MYMSQNYDSERSEGEFSSQNLMYRRPATRMFGMSLMNSTRFQAVEILINRTVERVPTVVSFMNAHCVNVAASDKTYAAALTRSDFILSDGSGMALAARLLGEERGENLNGTDWNGRALTVNEARPREERSSGGAGYGGRTYSNR